MKKKDGKKPADMTSEEAMKNLFPKRVIDEAKEKANPKPKRNTEK